MRCFSTLCLAVTLLAADKQSEPAKAGNELADIAGTALVGREPVKSALGIDPDVEMIAIEVRLRPKTDVSLAIRRDDFLLISRKDGQRSTAMHPSQIAGSGSLSVQTRAPGASGGMVGPRRGPIWGGMPGTGDRPRRIGGDNDIPSGIADGETRATISESKAADSPLLSALRQKELPQTSTADPLSGMLYFIFEGKHKLKDLELTWKTSAGNLILDFQK